MLRLYVLYNDRVAEVGKLLTKWLLEIDVTTEEECRVWLSNLTLFNAEAFYLLVQDAKVQDIFSHPYTCQYYSFETRTLTNYAQLRSFPTSVLQEQIGEAYKGSTTTVSSHLLLVALENIVRSRGSNAQMRMYVSACLVDLCMGGFAAIDYMVHTISFVKKKYEEDHSVTRAPDAPSKYEIVKGASPVASSQLNVWKVVNAFYTLCDGSIEEGMCL